MTIAVGAAQPDGLQGPRRVLAVGVLLVALVLVVLDGAIANVALPVISQALQATPAATIWVVSSYQLAVLVALLPCGAIGEMFGPRRVYLAGVALFTLASAVCAVSDTLAMLVAARFVQGLGGGAIMALAVMNLRFSVPQRQLGTIIGINAMVVAIASAAGPGIAGAILAVADWPWLFAVNVPLGLLVLALGGVLARAPGVKRRLDLAAVAANALMFVLFFLGAERVSVDPWMGLALIAGAGVCLWALLRIERASVAPIVPTDLFAAPAFRVAVIASVCCFTGQMLGLVALPFYLEDRLALSPAEVGLYMMPWPAAVALIAPISGRLSNRIKTAWLCAAGGAMLAVGLAVIGLFDVQGHPAAYFVGTVIAGLGFGLFQTPNNRILLLSAPKGRSGAAGAMQGTARLTGQTCGTIVLAVLFGALPHAAAPAVALILAAGFAAVAAAVSAGRARFEGAG